MIYLFTYMLSLDEDVYEVQMLAAQLLSCAGIEAFLFLYLCILLILTC